MKMKFTLLLFLIVSISCSENKEGTTPSDEENPVSENSNPPQVLGMDYILSDATFDETYATLKEALEDNANIKIVAEIDHMANAASVEKQLNPTKIIYFGNPNLGTPLMQENQVAGLDLPQKILVYQNEYDDVYVGFNNTTYFGNRHGLSGMEVLTMIQGALTNFSTGSSQHTLVTAENNKVALKEGIITKSSTKSCAETYAALHGIIENNPNLKIIAELDHAANAASVGLELEPTRLIIFGNPNLGTPLMQNAQTTALDLPQKMLVWTDADGKAYVSYNDPSFLAKRHAITENEEVLKTISDALNNISNAAISE